MSAVSAQTVQTLMSDIAECLDLITKSPKLCKPDQALVLQVAARYSSAAARAAYDGSGRYVCSKVVYRDLKVAYFDVSRLCLGCLLSCNKKRWSEVVAHSAISEKHMNLKKLTPLWGAAGVAYQSTIPDVDIDKAAKYQMFKAHIANIKTIENELIKVCPSLAIAVKNDTISKWTKILVPVLITAVCLTALGTIENSPLGKFVRKCKDALSHFVPSDSETNKMAQEGASAK